MLWAKYVKGYCPELLTHANKKYTLLFRIGGAPPHPPYPHFPVGRYRGLQKYMGNQYLVEAAVEADWKQGLWGWAEPPTKKVKAYA